MLPEVGSTIVSPGLILPSASATSIMLIAMRSLTDAPGFWYSNFTYTSALSSGTTRFNLTSGVLPINSVTLE